MVRELIGYSNSAVTAAFCIQVDKDHQVKAMRFVQERLEKAKSRVFYTYEQNSEEKEINVNG